MLEKVRFILVAREPTLAQAWRDAFDEFEAFEVVEGDIFDQQADAIVSPANSFGFMDGGIELLYSQHFGWDVEQRVREVLLREHDGELPVGQAIVVETGHAQVKFLISAPTMRVPMDVSKTANAHLAFRAVLRAVRSFNQARPDAIRTVLCPGLATGEGRMPPERCAFQMRLAYQVCVQDQALRKGGLAAAVEQHLSLIGGHEPKA